MSLALALAGCVFVSTPDWKLVWSDEFDRPGWPDPSRWTYENGYVRNHEQQYYTRRLENARIEDGKLIIEARKDHWDGHKITSASLTTQGKASWKYGRFEIRARLPRGNGTAPAFWTLGETIRTKGWPRSGEIDIMEYVGFDPDRIHGYLHTEAYNHLKRNQKGTSVMATRPYEEFHVYSVDWSPDKLEFFLDGRRYYTYLKEAENEEVWPFDQHHFLIINLAIGGPWAGMQGIDDAIFPAKYEIDYVRVFQAQ